MVSSSNVAKLNASNVKIREQRAISKSVLLKGDWRDVDLHKQATKKNTIVHFP